MKPKKKSPSADWETLITFGEAWVAPPVFICAAWTNCRGPAQRDEKSCAAGCRAGKQCPKWIEKYPTWLCQQFAIENGPVEIVHLPIKHGVWPFIEDLPIENGDFP